MDNKKVPVSKVVTLTVMYSHFCVVFYCILCKYMWFFSGVLVLFFEMFLKRSFVSELISYF